MTSHKPQQHSKGSLARNRIAATALTAGFLGLAALGNTGAALAANSARVQWANNGHFYQLFEGAPIIWSDAKTACERKSAHLVTIASEGEQGFVQSQLLAGRHYNNSYAIGGTSTDTYTWTWITGETWRYMNWNTEWSQPEHNSGENYLYLHVNYDNRKSPGGWFNGKADWTYTGYICEWSTNTFISTALVPDMNGNGSAEVATLFVDYKTGKHTVQIKDPKTDKLVNTLVFATSFTPPSGMVALKDINGNRSPEIGVLSTQYNFPSVHIKDAKTGATLNNMMFLTPDYKPKSVGIGVDSDRNGADDIVVLGVHKSTGAAKALIRDSKTGAALNDTPF